MLIALSPAWGFGLVLLLASAVVYRLVRGARHQAEGRPGSQASDSFDYSVDLTQSASTEGDFYLSCPNCEFAGPLDDLELVGQAIDCPMCEQPFVLLDPQSNASQYAGVK